jgi:hypothetical protein
MIAARMAGFIRRAAGDVAAEVDHADVVGAAERELHGLLDQQDAHALVAQPHHGLEDLPRDGRRESCGWFVERPKRFTTEGTRTTRKNEIIASVHPPSRRPGMPVTRPISSAATTGRPDAGRDGAAVNPVPH